MKEHKSFMWATEVFFRREKGTNDWEAWVDLSRVIHIEKEDNSWQTRDDLLKRLEVYGCDSPASALQALSKQISDYIIKDDEETE